MISSVKESWSDEVRGKPIRRGRWSNGKRDSLELGRPKFIFDVL